MKHVLVGMSGGVDSAVCAYILKQEGWDVTGVTLRTWESSGPNVNRCCEIDDAADACRKIGIPFHSFNASGDFKEKVITPFIEEYLCGRTPNPCIVCNRFVKWEKLLYHMRVLNADMIATGHFARIVKKDNGRFAVAASEHSAKDQSYMLWKLSQEQLSKTIMPLWNMTKEEVRKVAASAGLSVADKPDSQEICFIPDDDHARFITENHDGPAAPEGDFVDVYGNVLGRHKGIINYTVGQRKGLGIALGRPVFVKCIDACSNTVVLADDEDLYGRTVICKDINYMGIECLAKGESIRCTAKIRYHHAAQPAICHIEGDRLVIEFDEPVRAAAPGQSAVLYDHDGCIICGGIIDDNK